MLVDEQLVEGAQVGERKVYTLTEAGRRAAAEATVTEHPQEKPRDHGRPSAIALTKSGVSLAQALAQVAQTGTPHQSERAISIVDDARRKLYAILAED
ncbi:hypothetical protein GCM10025867_40620 [Frondihabitans sucicola]|uniref:Transcription regulator PadR N-terminal domain-containing protein n=1 Tax=Frondihabitans sucicola TaxID=1268041 RepID=A0ABM8GTM3_9MICO|nr:hypothetical protein GCM10025867_40620 [Frondihabitans sucicola]